MKSLVADEMFLGPERRALFEKIRVRNEFRAHFVRALKRCVRKGFLVEESFGMVWEETLEQIRLPEDEQSGMYSELIAWAKSGL